jgi:mRNA interferase MazF
MIRQGEIYIVNFGEKYNSEFGKRRPALVIQSDSINILLHKMEYKSVAVIPLTTQTIENAYLRVKIQSRDNLKKESDIVCNWICTVDLQKIQREDGVLTKLSKKELEMVKQKVDFLLD